MDVVYASGGIDAYILGTDSTHRSILNVYEVLPALGNIEPELVFKLVRSYAIPNAGSDLYWDVALNNSTNKAYMLSRDGNPLPHIIELDLTSGNTTIEHLESGPRGNNASGTAIAVNHETNTIYSLIETPNIVIAIDGKNNCILAEIPVGQNPMGLAVDPERNMIYVTNELSGTISAINGTTNNPTLNTAYKQSTNPSL